MFASMLLGQRDLMVNQTQEKLQKMFLVSLESWVSKKIVTSQHVLFCLMYENRILWIRGRIPNPVLGVQGRPLIGNHHTLILSIKAIAG